MTFLEHLEDLRKRLFYSFVALFVGVIPAWFFHKELYHILAIPVTKYLPEGTKLAFTKLTAPFMLYIKVSFLAAIFFMSPFIFIQFWMFVAPGLYRKERKYVVPFVLLTSIFFMANPPSSVLGCLLARPPIISHEYHYHIAKLLRYSTAICTAAQEVCGKKDRNNMQRYYKNCRLY